MLTVGHSNRSIEDFAGLLRAHGVELLVDIRTVPRSRHNPQFNKDVLPESLAGVGIEYRHLAGLGGLRHPRPDSTNTGWRNLSFRGYADYMQTAEFERSVAELLRLSEKRLLAAMCAEAVPWRCHRSLLADCLIARGVEVRHIIDRSEPAPHKLTSFARVDGTSVTYPPESLGLFGP